MKRYNKNTKYSIEFIESCIHMCLKNKWKRRDVSYFFAEYMNKMYVTEMGVHRLEKIIHNQILEDKTELYSTIHDISVEIRNEIMNREIKFKPIIYKKRYDECSRKTREIGISTIKQQVYDYIAVESLKEMFMAKIGYYQCSSLKGRGQVFGKNAIEKWIRKNPKKTKYAYKCDIKKFYPSVNHDILKSFLRRDIKNEDTLYILDSIIDTYGENGLCIGSYLSQYLANYFLSYAYHYVTEKMLRKRNKKNGELVTVNMVSHCLFYMDDIIIFSPRKSDLKIVINKFNSYIKNTLGLEIKEGSTLFKVDSMPIDMMGYKIYRTHTETRKRIFLKSRKYFIKYKGKRNDMDIKDAKSITSYFGYIKHTDSFNFCRKYKVYRTLKYAREVCSYVGGIHRQTT